MSERKEIPRKYREPRTEEERELVERFRRAGIELRIEDVEPGETRLMFFGRGVGPGDPPTDTAEETT